MLFEGNLSDAPAPAAIEACVRLLEAVADDRAVLASVDADLRRRLLVAAGRLSRPERAEQRLLAKALRRKDRGERKANDERLLEATGMREQRRAPVFPTPPADGAAALPPGSAEASERAELREARKCYVCKAEYTLVHHFYDSMCPPCAERNWAKRHQTARLEGTVALVTGARVKIGYQVAIMLLRAGARVIVTTRFPRDAAKRFAAESDHERWAERLSIYGLDLRHTPSVERLALHLDGSLDRLDFLINNAAQTVRRPTGFYAHLVAGETEPLGALPPAERRLLDDYERLGRRGLAPVLSSEAPFVGLRAPALLSQVAALREDLETAAGVFPAGRLDADLQQLDLRANNSWRLALGEVPTVELFEVHLVNAIAPFVLASKLKPALLRSPGTYKHVVNVSAVEGQFYRPFKTDKHPHTNMAKAALNMLTRTSAADYARSGIYMNSVDTGWVTDEDPAAIAAKKRAEHGFSPPLDIVDGAARICDPVFTSANAGEHVWGKFLKDYAPADW